MGGKLAPVDFAFRERDVSRARAGPGDEAFEAAVAEGRKAPPEGAIEDALAPWD